MWYKSLVGNEVLLLDPKRMPTRYDLIFLMPNNTSPCSFLLHQQLALHVLPLMVVVEHVSLGPLALLLLYVIGLRYKQQKKLDEAHTCCLLELLAKDVTFVMKKRTPQILPKSMNYLKHIDHQSTCLPALTCKKDDFLNFGL
jgi:hypothetical protein